MISTSTALAILGACLPLALGALNKPVINPPFPNGLSSLNNGLTANYPMTGYTQATLDSSQTPQWCKDAASSNGKSQNFFIYAVKYNDVSELSELI